MPIPLKPATLIEYFTTLEKNTKKIASTFTKRGQQPPWVKTGKDILL
jgi:hypothetical protein